MEILLNKNELLDLGENLDWLPSCLPSGSLLVDPSGRQSLSYVI